MLVPVSTTNYAATHSPMTFELTSGAENLPSCQCIVATDEIEQETPARFQDFLSNTNLPHPLPMVVLHSGGGNVLGALALGETLRNEGATTAVGKSVRVVDAGTDEVSWYITKGACYSACLYSFAGGVQRLITPNGKIGRANV